jgi:hypothetical protein
MADQLNIVKNGWLQILNLVCDRSPMTPMVIEPLRDNPNISIRCYPVHIFRVLLNLVVFTPPTNKAINEKANIIVIGYTFLVRRSL